MYDRLYLFIYLFMVLDVIICKLFSTPKKSLELRENSYCTQSSEQ